MLHTTQVINYNFSHVEIAALRLEMDDNPEEEYNIEVRSTGATQVAENDEWEVSLDVKFEPADPETPTRYRGHITVHGRFKAAGPAEGKLEDTMRIQGASLLFGAAHEMVMSITSRATLGPLVLPTIDGRALTQ